MNKKILSVLLAGLMLAAAATGCGEKKTTTIVGEAPQHEDGNTKILEPGVEYTAKLGEKFDYIGTHLDIEFLEISRTAADPDGTGCYSYALVFKAKNNGSETATVNMMDDFSVDVDGRTYSGDNLFTAMSAANAAIRYQVYERYDAEIEPGEEKTGFIPIGLPEDDSWFKMTVKYKPASSSSNDYILFTVEEPEVVDRTTKAGNLSEPLSDTPAAVKKTEEAEETEETEEELQDAAEETEENADSETEEDAAEE